MTLDLGTRSTCDQAYIEQQALREIECNYGRGGSTCNIPGWKQAVGAYDKVNNWLCMY